MVALPYIKEMQTTIVNTKLGEHRGKPRVLEGYKLLREGYSPGTKFDLELKDSQIVLRVKEEGKFHGQQAGA